MSELLTAAELAPADLAQALPLLRVTWPELDLPAWQIFATEFCGANTPEARITGLFDSAGGLCGLLASRVDLILGAGRVLAIPVFTAVDIANSLAPVEALLDAATVEMKKNDCVGLQIQLTTEQGELTKRLHALGFGASGTLHSIPEMIEPIC